MPCSLIIYILPTPLLHWITDFLGGACRRSSRGEEQPELSRAERINAFFSTRSSWFWTPQEAASAVHRGMSSSDALQTFNHLPKLSHVEKTIGKSNEVVAAKYYFFVPEHMIRAKAVVRAAPPCERRRIYTVWDSQGGVRAE